MLETKLSSIESNTNSILNINEKQSEQLGKIMDKLLDGMIEEKKEEKKEESEEKKIILEDKIATKRWYQNFILQLFTGSGIGAGIIYAIMKFFGF